MVPIEVLEKIETITELKILVAIVKECEATNSNTFLWSQNDFIEKAEVSRNSVKKSIDNLMKNRIITKVKKGVGTTPNEYRLVGLKIGAPKIGVPKVAPPKVDPTRNWSKSVASTVQEKKEGETEMANIINNNINYKNITNDLLIKEDINSLSVVNENIYMTDEELGKLANRIFKEVFLPLANVKKPAPKFFFPQQMKLMKDYLVEYRTEQVIAGILYWATINPPADGLKSLVFLKFADKKGKTKLMEALDYYKQQYLESANEVVAQERIMKAVAKEEEDKRRQMEEAEKVESMSDDDFVKNLLSGLGALNLGE